MYQYHEQHEITQLPLEQVFVFVSNLAGKHQAGAAKTAALYFGALSGIGRGWSGQSFAIPFFNEHLQTMPLQHIQHYIEDFKIYTHNHPKQTYFINELEYEQSGYTVDEIAPLFQGISLNVIFPSSFRPYLEGTS